MRGAAEVDKNSCRKPYEVRRKDPKRTLKIILREADTKIGNDSYDTVFSHMKLIKRRQKVNTTRVTSLP